MSAQEACGIRKGDTLIEVPAGSSAVSSQVLRITSKYEMPLPKQDLGKKSGSDFVTWYAVSKRKPESKTLSLVGVRVREDTGLESAAVQSYRSQVCR